MIPAVWAGFLRNATVLITVTEIKGSVIFFMKDLSYITDLINLFAVLNGIASVRFPYREPTNIEEIEDILNNFKSIETGNKDKRWKSYSIVRKKMVDSELFLNLKYGLKYILNVSRYYLNPSISQKFM